MKKTFPNLFDYATSELSQDAFICWLLSWACDLDEDEQARYAPRRDDQELRDCARDLVVAFLKKFEAHAETRRNDIAVVTRPEQQKFKIDVYFTATLRSGERFRFIVEDKTHTTHHSDQLTRYAEAIQAASNESADHIIGIYFKTGYVYDWDKELDPHFRLFTAEEFLAVLCQCKSEHPILREYRDYLAQMQWEITETERQVLRATSFVDALTGGWARAAQWHLMETIFRPSGKELEHNFEDSDVRRLKNGTNNSGYPWTHYKFFKFELGDGTGTDWFFWRVDRRSDKPYLSLRAYNWFGGEDGRKNAKLAIRSVKRWCRYVRLFGDAVAAVGANTPPFSLKADSPLGNTSGKFEAEVGVFFLDTETNTPEALIEHIPTLHSQVYAQLEKLMAAAPGTRGFYLSDIREPTLGGFRKFVGQTRGEDMVVVTDHAMNAELVEMKLSCTSWTRLFGEEGLVIMVYQYETTPGVAIRTFLAASVSDALVDRFRQAGDAAGVETHVRLMDGWPQWRKVFEKHSYPEDSYIDIRNVALIGERLREEYTRVQRVVSKLESDQ